jgi:nitroimidazol reductase NimA-like FMN-containing flavoprotein (pyridoxamine 5'-phosphate oxidase superfamily)
MTMPSDGLSEEISELGGLDEIDEPECWRLLATQPVGRIAVIVGHYPLVFPVNHIVDGGGIFFRTGAGTKLWATHRSNVTFEVDQIDVARHSGWSVMVRGSARELSFEHNPGLAERADAIAAEPWAPGRRHHLVRIVADSITGRQIRLPDLPPATDLRGYL